MVVASAICINIAVLLGTLDGVYYHLWKYRLYGRQDSRFEHVLHTVRAFLFIPIIWLLYGENYGGWALRAGVALTLDQALLRVFERLAIG